MSLAALQACLDREYARAAASFRLDDELGTHHGIAWADFVLLESLQSGAMLDTELAGRLGMLRSHLLMRVRPLQKLGLVTCQVDGEDSRTIALSVAGRRLANEARDTAAHVCAQL
jgi:MarR family transcriptional regulator, organic hydroperoxide resistance regulator